MYVNLIYWLKLAHSYDKTEAKQGCGSLKHYQLAGPFIQSPLAETSLKAVVYGYGLHTFPVQAPSKCLART